MKAFYEKVWEKMRKIPKGKVTTYKEIGKGLGSKAYRAIGNVCRNNPYAPEVPCHRVVKSSQGIGGYAFGEELKKDLINFEKKIKDMIE